MKDIIGTNDHLSFYKLVELSKRKNAIVRRYEEDLKEYATLRNAIVHHQTSTEYAIAEPHDEIVQALETIDEALAKPVTVGEMFHPSVAQWADRRSNRCSGTADGDLSPVSGSSVRAFWGLWVISGFISASVNGFVSASIISVVERHTGHRIVPLNVLTQGFP